MATITWGTPELAGTGSVYSQSGTAIRLTCSYSSTQQSNYFKIRGTCTIPCCSGYSFVLGYGVSDVNLTRNVDGIKYSATGSGFSKSYQFSAIYSPDYRSVNISETVDPPRDISIVIDLDLGYGNHSSGTNYAYLENFVGTSTPIAPTISNLTPTVTTVNTATQFTITTGTACPQVSYSWNFGDGGTSSSAPPVSHTYTSAGLFPLSVYAYNTAGTSPTLTENIAVRGLPTASISPQNKIVLIDGKVNFTSAGSSVGYPPYSPSADLAYQWSCVNSSSQQTGFTYVDGTSSTSEEPHIQFTELDTYTVSLIVTNGYGSSPSVSTSVYVVEKEPPTDEQMRDDIIIITTDAMVTKRFEDV